MGYRTLKQCIVDLRKTGRLVDVDEPVDPNLELAAVQRRVFERGGPALYFSKPIGCSFPMVSNLFGTEERIEYIFRDGVEPLRKAIQWGADPLQSRLEISTGLFSLGMSGWFSRPKFVRRAPVFACRTTLDVLPKLVSWPRDGGPYITLPQVYTEDPDHPGVGRSNLGMYRVQLSGNDYEPNREVGLHYQIQRGIAAHHAAAIRRGEPLPVNVFVGGAPAMTLAAVMPLPEGLSELLFAGLLGRHRIPLYSPKEPQVEAVLRRNLGVPLSVYAEADFCLTGFLDAGIIKPEGPFGDHLGYYSLRHDFPVFRVENVFHRKDAVWPFTVVGRPPQEDSMFGRFIHKIVGSVVTQKLPGVHAVHAVDEAGVHPLLLAIGSERYVPYEKNRRAAELHTLAHAVLGFGQLSLAKFLFLAAREDDPGLDVYNTEKFLKHVLCRADWRRDVHFVTQTTADTLDYSGGELNRGSKMFVAVSGPPIRELPTEFDGDVKSKNPRIAFPGVVCIEGNVVPNDGALEKFPLIVIVDNSEFTAASLRNFLWTTFTKSDPAVDVHGVGEFTENKHWGCTGPLIVDARRKPHHAPELEEPPEIARRADALTDRILRSLI